MTVGQLRKLIKESLNDYDYEDEVRESLRIFIRSYIKDNNIQTGSQLIKWRSDIFDDAKDDLTGGNNGSYWNSDKKAQEVVSKNHKLLASACYDNGVDIKDVLKRGPSYADSLIRSYVLNQNFEDILYEMADSLDEEDSSDDEFID